MSRVAAGGSLWICFATRCRQPFDAPCWRCGGKRSRRFRQRERILAYLAAYETS